MQELIEKIKRFEKKKILVIGDLVLDQYTMGSCSRISPEAPFPILKVVEEKNNPGGAGNTAVNIKALGSEPLPIGIVGKDIWGEIFKKELEANEIDSSFILASSLSTIRKERLFSQGQQAGPRIDRNDKIPENKDSEKTILQRFRKNLEGSDTVIVSDYAKGTLSPDLIETIIQICNETNKQVIVDPRPEHTLCYRNASFITPNFNEACKMASLELEFDLENAKALAKTLYEKLKSKIVLTLSEKGILFYDGDFQYFPTFKRQLREVSGAGDSVVAALAVGLSNSLDIKDAVCFANHAGGVAIEKPGVHAVALQEVIEDIKLHNNLI